LRLFPNKLMKKTAIFWDIPSEKVNDYLNNRIFE
jgi:hypothetical protein